MKFKGDVQMDKFKTILLERGNIFLEKANLARQKIANIACPFIPPGSVRIKRKHNLTKVIQFYLENIDTFNVACGFKSINRSL